MGGGGGGGGCASAATTGGGLSVAWGRGTYVGAGGVTGPPKRQRNKLSSKDLTEEQRMEGR